MNNFTDLVGFLHYLSIVVGWHIATIAFGVNHIEVFLIGYFLASVGNIHQTNLKYLDTCYKSYKKSTEVKCDEK